MWVWSLLGGLRHCLGVVSLDSVVVLWGGGIKEQGQRRGATAHCSCLPWDPWGRVRLQKEEGKSGQGPALTAGRRGWGWGDGPGMEVFSRRGFSKSFVMKLLSSWLAANSSRVPMVSTLAKVDRHSVAGDTARGSKQRKCQE